MGGGKGGGSEQVVGYRYYIGFQMAFCHGPIDAVREINVSDKLAWPTGADYPSAASDGQLLIFNQAIGVYINGRPPGAAIPDSSIATGVITGSSQIYINNPNLFGGDDREGGVAGFVNFHFGGQGEQRDPYLIQQLGAQVPAFRGVVTGVAQQCYVAAMNPYIKPWSIYASRTQAQTDGSAQWYAGKATINTYDMNPMHIIRECLTNPVWGKGTDGATEIDDASFVAAADILYAEGFGLSFVWADTRDVDSFVQIVCDHIDGSLYQDRVTNKWRMKLVRFDYNPATIPVFNMSNILALGEIGRPLPSELVNQLTLTYWNRATRKNDTIILDNQPLQDSIGGKINPNDLDRTGIALTDLANRVAARELRTLGTSLLTGRITCNRDALALYMGAPFKLSIPKRKIAEVICRVTNIDYGTTDAAGIEVSFIQDIFALPSTSYIVTNPTRWEDPRVAPALSPFRYMGEVPYYTLLQNIGQAGYDTLTPTGGTVAVAGTRASQTTYSMQAWMRQGGDAYSNHGTFSHCAECRVPLGGAREETSTLFVDQQVDPSEIYYGRYAAWGDELVMVLDYIHNTNVLVLARGVLDTVPVAHATNTRIMFIEGSQHLENEEYLAGESVYAKILTQTALGQLRLTSAPEDGYTIVGRHIRPYAPGKFRINGLVTPPKGYGEDLALTWAHRDRTQQTAYIVQQGENSIGPEVGVTYNLVVKKTDGTVLRTVLGLTVTSWTYTAAMSKADGLWQGLRFELSSVRGGYNSWQSQFNPLDRHGLGFQLGLEIGGVAA